MKQHSLRVPSLASPLWVAIPSFQKLLQLLAKVTAWYRCFLVWHYLEGTVTSLAGSTPLECVGGGLAHTWDLSPYWVLQSLTR